jgi:NAD(P)-dependent dehydrogenase (short-subunit alcohol dehydrogenase family)
MIVEGKVVVVTGAGNGIGRALAERFARDGATVVVSDFDEQTMNTVADGIAAARRRCDVGSAQDLHDLIEWVEADIGPIALMCSNPAIFGGAEGGGLDTSEETWDRSWQVNVMSHVRVARQLIPRMVERGGGYFLQTLSAAALITSNSWMAYTVTKHAGLGTAEWIMLNYADRGIGVSCLCPTAVETRPGQFDELPDIGLVQTADEVADITVAGLADERFLILPNPAVGGSFRKKATDYDAWLERTNGRLRAMGHDFDTAHR